ncbi:MAG: amino acid adenylation domain-containing protein [Pseudomonadota bacterium]
MKPLPEHLHPLSSVQREIWFNQMLHPEVPIYNTGGYVHIRGPVDPGRFEKALRQVILQNDALRTILHEGNPLPLQEFPESMDFTLNFQDLSEEKDPETLALQWMQQALVEPYRLYGQPLFSYALIRVSGQRYFWFFRYHHLITDGWSIYLTAQRVADLYSAPDPESPGESMPSYIDFIEDDQAYLGYARYHKDEEYWREKFKNPPSPLIRKPCVETNRASPRPGGRAAFWLKRSLFNRLETFARQNRVSGFHMILGLLYVYFVQAGGAEEFVVGLPLLNRGSKAFKQTLGLFTGVTPARLCLGRNLTFRELVQSLGAELRKDYRHQRFPLGDINRGLGILGKPGEQVFDVILSYPAFTFSGRFKEAPAELMILLHGYEDGTLSFFIFENGDESDVKVDICYSREAFQEEEIEWLKDRLVFLLKEILDHPDMPVKDFTLLPQREYQKIVYEFNETSTDYPRDKTIAQLFEERVEKAPEEIAVVSLAGEGGRSLETRLTYRDLNCRANHLARTLEEDHGLGEEEIVGVLMDSSEQVPASLLGILKAGGAYMPMDPASPEKRVKTMLADAACRLLIADERHRESLSDMPDLTIIGAEWGDEQHGGPDIPNPEPRGSGDSLAYLIYTSGSTGRPKGSLIVQRAVSRLVLQTNTIELDRTTRILRTGSLAFDASTFEIWGALLNGGRIYLPPERAVLDAREARRMIGEHRITTIWLTASLFNQLADLDPGLFEGLRHLLVGGERLSAPHVNKIRAAHPDLAIINGYGPTENTTFTACYHIEHPFSHDIPIGRPIANTRVYILDAGDRPVPIGVPGEICTGGDGLARGYMNAPEMTAQRFVPNPFEPGERMYRTGDKGRWLPDGSIEFLGRDDDQVKIRGYRIELGEIENRLLDHEAVREAVLVAKDVNRDGHQELVAYMTGNAPLDAARIRDFLKKVLPDYMIPAYFIQVEKIPLTVNGKVDKEALSGGRLLETGTRREPETPMEKHLWSIWRKYLNGDKIGVTDNFFDVGGNSLLLVRVCSEINKGSPHTLNMIDLFTYTTISDLAAFIEKKGSPEVALWKVHDRVERQRRAMSFRNNKRSAAKTRRHKEKQI